MKINPDILRMLALKHNLQPTDAPYSGPAHLEKQTGVVAFAADVAALAVQDFLDWVATANLEDGKSALDQYKDHLFDSLLK